MNGTYIQYAANTPLFASHKGEPTRLTKCGVETMMRALGKRSGVIRVHPHLLLNLFVVIPLIIKCSLIIYYIYKRK